VAELAPCVRRSNRRRCHHETKPVLDASQDQRSLTQPNAARDLVQMHALQGSRDGIQGGLDFVEKIADILNAD